MLPEVHPREWADAIIAVIRGGGWMAFALLALFIISKWPPWRRTGKED
jgi:hypothetical protein